MKLTRKQYYMFKMTQVFVFFIITVLAISFDAINNFTYDSRDLVITLGLAIGGLALSNGVVKKTTEEPTSDEKN